jgi:hypothetical protein
LASASAIGAGKRIAAGGAKFILDRGFVNSCRLDREIDPGGAQHRGA